MAIEEKRYSQRRACGLVGLEPKTYAMCRGGWTMPPCGPQLKDAIACLLKSAAIQSALAYAATEGGQNGLITLVEGEKPGANLLRVAAYRPMDTNGRS